MLVGEFDQGSKPVREEHRGGREPAELVDGEMRLVAIGWPDLTRLKS
jgi:hypothetical protein